MSAVLLGKAEHDTPEWHALRAGGIGASEIAAVVGLSRWDSPFSLWHVKKGNLPGRPTLSHMRWGQRLEPVVLEWWLEQHPEYEAEASPGTFAHNERDWQRCNPDALLWRAGEKENTFPTALYEGKISRFGDGFGKSGTDEIPLAYRCQVQHSLDVFGLRFAHLAVLIGGSEAREYTIEADPEDQAHLRTKGAAFWASVMEADEPPLDCTDATYQAVVQLNPDLLKGEGVDLNSETWVAYLDAKNAQTEATEALTLAKSTILHAMRGVQNARIGGMTVLRRQRSSAGTYYLKEVAS